MKFEELKTHICKGPLDNGAFKTTEISELIFMCYMFLGKLFELEQCKSELFYAHFSHEEIRLICEDTIVSNLKRPNYPDPAVNYFSIFEKVLEKDQVVASEFKYSVN